MNKTEALARLITNLQEQLRPDPNALWLSLQYGQRNTIDYEKFINTDVVGEIIAEHNARAIANQYKPIELMRKLNLIVLNDTMETTYAKILKDGMPWLWGKGEFSKHMMVEHLRGITDLSFKKHENDEFPDQLTAELELLDKLRKLGELRRSDYAGGRYKGYINKVKVHDKAENEMPFIVQAAAFFNPFIRIASDVFTSAQTKLDNDRLTDEYLEINRRAYHWISGIKSNATKKRSS